MGDANSKKKPPSSSSSSASHGHGSHGHGSRGHGSHGHRSHGHGSHGHGSHRERSRSPPPPSSPDSPPPSSSSRSSASVIRYSSVGEIRKFYPKRPRTAFNYFVQKEAKEYPPPMDVAMCDLAERWKQMTIAEKKVFVDRSKEDRKRYERQKETYRLRKQQVIKRPVSGYALWTKYFLSKNKSSNDPMPELISQAAEQWNAMIPTEKDVWNKKSLEASEEYAETMKEVFDLEVRQRYGKYDARINFMKPAFDDKEDKERHRRHKDRHHHHHNDRDDDDDDDNDDDDDYDDDDRDD